MAEVVITVMIVMVFGTLLFSSASRRYARAERNIAKTEARLAAESVVQILAGKILKEESSEVIEKLVSRHGLPVTEGVIWADTENGESEKIRTVVTSFWREDGSELVLHAGADRKCIDRSRAGTPIRVYTIHSGSEGGERAMKKRKKILSDHSGMTLVEILTAFFILMLASKAVVSCISGYSRVIGKSRELSAAGTEVERLTGDAEYAAAAEIHLEIGGEEFVESGSYVEETVKDSDRPVTGFWADQAVMEEIFADGE